MATEVRKNSGSRYSNSGSTPIYFNRTSRSGNSVGEYSLRGNDQAGRYANSGRVYTSSPYVQGSAAPQYEPEKIRKAKEDYAKRARAQVEEKVLKNRLASREYSSGQVITMVVCALVVLVMISVYMITLSGVRTSKTAVENMKLEYATILNGNALTEARIQDSINYTDVYDYVTGTLGMRLPGAQQVVTYEKNAQEYVTKKADIPNE